ncbi:MAG: tetratricopeptide repeat protein [Calditrichaceae bacterium]|nr:tetratricopeptide repeat protein [Calditrichaceae bacterium]MBN2710439.1 tetratricopeptide repeat protein [Calditrichaceae bacterium]RQV93625.1 MAG: tetratricopeptide repeat protein [Calditrichota bacterium]
MKKFLFTFFVLLLTLIVITGCRPPEIESAAVELNAQRYDTALQYALEATQKYPDNAEAWYYLGSSYGKKDQYTDMVKAFEKSLSINSNFAKQIEQERMIYFQKSYNAGVGKYNLFVNEQDRSSAKAKELLKEAIDKFESANLLKNDYSAVSLSALCYSMLEDSVNALKNYQLLTEMKPDTAAAWIALGQYNFNLKDYETSAQNLEKALEIEPENKDAISLLAQVYDFLGNKEKALTLYTKAIELDPAEKAYPFNLGLLYFKMATKEGVEESLRDEYLQKCSDNFARVINLDPEIKEPYDIRSNVLIQLKQFDEALVVLKQALDYFPEEYAFWFNTGVVYNRLNRNDEAKKAFDKAEQIQKSN